MKSFFEWFKSSTKVKRWIFLIILGIILTCYGFTKVLVRDKMEFSDLWSIIITFVIGFLFIVIGIVFIQKRNLEILVEANDVRKSSGKKNVNIKSLIFNKKVYEEGPKIVVIGGGTGVDSLISGLKKYTSNITVLLPMADTKEITHAKQNLELLPLDEIKSAIVSMSDKEELMEKLIYWDFKHSGLEGINFGDLYMFAMNEIFDNPAVAIQKCTEVLNITGKVIPITLDETTICAELSNGTVEGKEKIPETVITKLDKINRVFLSPSNCKPASGVIEAINEAEAIIVGPGSLYTNIIPTLLVKNVVKAIKESKAMKIYISNLMTKPGETDGYNLSDHLEAIKNHCGTNLFDYCLSDTGEIVPEYIRKYNKNGSDVVEIDSSKISTKGPKIIQKNMSYIKDGKIRHNPDAMAINIISLICNELVFKDKKNEAEYILLNSVLKEQKKQEKKRQKLMKKNGGKIPEKKKMPKMKSKFSTKYKDRIEYMQDNVSKKK